MFIPHYQLSPPSPSLHSSSNYLTSEHKQHSPNYETAPLSSAESFNGNSSSFSSSPSLASNSEGTTVVMDSPSNREKTPSIGIMSSNHDMAAPMTERAPIIATPSHYENAAELAVAASSCKRGPMMDPSQVQKGPNDFESHGFSKDCDFDSCRAPLIPRPLESTV